MAELLDLSVGERAEIVHRRAQCLERRATGLVRHRDGDFGAPRERAQQLPFGAGQILEAVREHRLVVPRLEVRLEPLDGATAKEVAVPAAEPFQLRPVCRIETREITVELVGLEQPRLELGERRSESVRKAGKARGAAEAVQRGVADDPPDEQAPLRILEEGPCVAGAVRDPLEDIVEGPDRSAHERRLPCEQVALDTFDVRPVRHDQDGLVFEHAQIALQQECDFARAGRPCDQAEAHRPILDRGPDGSGAALGKGKRNGGKSVKRRES